MSDAPRPGEIVADHTPAADAHLTFIGRLRTPWTTRAECPRQGTADGPECRVEVFAPWQAALDGLGRFEEIELLYWMDRARRDRLTQHPAHLAHPRDLLAALPGAAQSYRHLPRPVAPDRGGHAHRARPRLPRRNAATRYQARPMRVHAPNLRSARCSLSGPMTPCSSPTSCAT